MDHTPRFRVRAAGSFRQRPGCPAYAEAALGPARLAELCAGECDHPTDERKRITRIEVVRIRPQALPGESVDPLIEDPWKIVECPGDPVGCDITFEDPEFAAAARDTTYYVRAIEEPGPIINAGGMRCTLDEAGGCVDVDACHQNYLTDIDDDCLAEGEARAWSSPIYVDFVAGPPES